MSSRLAPVGVIGGAGPAAAARLASRVCELAQAEGAAEDCCFPPLVLWNVGAPGLDAGGVIDPAAVGNHLNRGAVALAAAGCDRLVVACNAAHAHLPVDRRLAGLDVIDMVGLTADHTVSLGAATVGVVAAPSTMRCGLYDAAFAGRARLLWPDTGTVTPIIAAAMAGDTNPGALDTVVAGLFAHGADVVVFGCTELSLIDRTGWAGPVVDCVDVSAGHLVAAHTAGQLAAQEVDA